MIYLFRRIVNFIILTYNTASMTKNNLSAIKAVILAAGKGVRMNSDLPKVFHKIAGKPMLEYVIRAVRRAGIKDICVVVGHKRELIQNYLKHWEVGFAIQEEQLGTAHALLQAGEYLKDFSGVVLVLAGDMPLIKPQTIKSLVEFHKKKKAAATVLTAVLDDAASFGRIIRDKNRRLIRIVEKKDASLEELEIKEVNTGIYCFSGNKLFAALEEVRPENVQKEYYLTDVIEIFRKKRQLVYAFSVKDPKEALGVNTKEELENVSKLISGKAS